MLHAYVEMAAVDTAVQRRYPGIAAHLRACGPCGEDFQGLLAAVCPGPPVAGGPGHVWRGAG